MAVEAHDSATDSGVVSRNAPTEENVRELLRAFARKTWRSVILEGADDFDKANALLLAAIDSGGVDLRRRIAREKKKLQTVECADAPEWRARSEADRKLGIAEAMSRNDLRNVIRYCGERDGRPREIDPDVDDITAAAQILPWFLAGYARHRDGDLEGARYYLSQVEVFHRKGVMTWGESYFIETAGESYRTILEMTEAL